MKKNLFAFICTIVLLACNDSGDQQIDPPAPPPPAIGFTVLNVLPHDTASFTQGLSYYQGRLFESTGQYGTSWFGPVNPANGRIDRKISLDQQYFGEGHTFLDGKLYLITWRERKGFIYDAETFSLIKEFPLLTEGWGLTTDGKHLILSDGSSNLFFLDAQTGEVRKTLGVTDAYGPVPNLNELEYINGFIYANQWQTRFVLKIDPENGQVTGRMDFRDILAEISSREPGFEFDVKTLNGIAWDSTSNRMYITGKYWPNMYEIKLN